MKFDAAKAWPYPVLRPAAYGDDYPDAEFEVEIEPILEIGSFKVLLKAEFEMSDPDLLDLVDKRKAKYALLVKASATHCRRLFSAFEPHIQDSFEPGELSGRIEISSYLVCIENLNGFQASGWHPDFDGLAFDIPAGAVLAEYGPPERYWIDPADEKPLGSILAHKSRKNLQDGLWDIDLHEKCIYIVTSEADYVRFENARAHASLKAEESQNLMNGVYLPALVAALYEIDKNTDSYSEYRWFASLVRRLDEAGCPAFGESGANRLMDAQKLLELPFSRIPVIANASMDPP